MSSPSLGFDDSGNFYILSEYTDASGTSGALALQKYKFTGSAPTTDNFTTNEQTPAPYRFAPSNLKVIYQWDNSGTNDQAYDPTMAVDDNLATIPSGVASPADPYSGNIYVSWASVDINQATNPEPFNPNRIRWRSRRTEGIILARRRSPAQNNYNTHCRERRHPALTVSQGRLPSESGVSGDTGITAGQVAVTFDDFGDSPSRSSPIQ